MKRSAQQTKQILFDYLAFLKADIYPNEPHPSVPDWFVHAWECGAQASNRSTIEQPEEKGDQL